jgi:hemerythrin-like domain-containing protein
MTEMSMNKAIHGALRRDLDRFVGALTDFPAGNRDRAQQLVTAWANFDDQLTHHHEGEHTIAWPHLEAVGVSPELLATMDAEHDTMADALSAADRAMQKLADNPSGDQAQMTLDAVQRLRSATVLHLDHEESEIESVYLQNRDHPEIKAMGKKFAKVSPARGGRFFAWMLDGATPDQRAAISDGVPGPVLSVLTGVFGRSYRKNIAPVWAQSH